MHVTSSCMALCEGPAALPCVAVLSVPALEESEAVPTMTCSDGPRRLVTNLMPPAVGRLGELKIQVPRALVIQERDRCSVCCRGARHACRTDVCSEMVLGHDMGGWYLQCMLCLPLAHASKPNRWRPPSGT